MIPKKCPVCGQNTLSLSDDYIVCTNCYVYKKPLNVIQKPLAWASHRLWLWRLPIFGWFIIMFVGVLHKPAIILNRLSNPLFAFDLGIHELGHLLFSPFGDFMRISGGSLFQCLFPLFWLIACLQKGWYFAASLCWCWLGLNLFDVAVYAADARTRILPLMLGPASLGVNPANTEGAYKRGHDWYQILSRTHHLNSDLAIAHGLKIAATISFLLGLIFAGILLSQMIASSLQRLLKKITLAKNKAIQ